MTEEEAQLAYRTAVPVDDVDYLQTAPNDGLAVVWLDISDRPDLKQLGTQQSMPDGYSLFSLL